MDRLPVNLPLGRYAVLVCADLKLAQTKKGDNCQRPKDGFYVIKKSWTGTASGENTFSGDAEGSSNTQTWQAVGVTYAFARPIDTPGRFLYQPKGGNVNYQVTISDSEGGCTGAGGATFPVDVGEIIMDYANQHYTIVGYVPEGSMIPVTIDCPDGHSTTHTTPVVGRFVDNGVTAGFTYALPFGQDLLSGELQDSYDGITHYRDNWSLR